MSEQYGKLIDEAVDEFWSARAGAGSPPGGAKAIRRRVTRRREIIVTTCSILGTLLVITPIIVYAASPKAIVPAHPSTSVFSTTPVRPAVDRLVAEVVAANPKMTADSPCPSGGGRMFHANQVLYPSGGLQRGGAHAIVQHATRANMDDDPTFELVAELTCTNGIGDSFDDFVVVFELDNAGKLFGSQIVTKAKANERFDGLVARPGGLTVVVKRPLNGEFDNDMRVQRRDFSWSGQRIEQVAGSTSFPAPSTTDLKLIASKLEFGPAANGKRTGTLTLAVENIGKVRSDEVQVLLRGNDPDKTFELTPRSWVWASDWTLENIELKTHAPLEPDEEVTLEVTVTADENVSLDPFRATVFTGGGDPNFSNNEVDVVVTLS